MYCAYSREPYLNWKSLILYKWLGHNVLIHIVCMLIHNAYGPVAEGYIIGLIIIGSCVRIPSCTTDSYDNDIKKTFILIIVVYMQMLKQMDNM